MTSVTEFYLSQMCHELKDSQQWTNPQTTIVMTLLLITKGVFLVGLKRLVKTDNEANAEEEAEGNFLKVLSCCSSCGFESFVRGFAQILSLVSGLTFLALILRGYAGAFYTMHSQGTSGEADRLTWDMFIVIFCGLLSYNPFFIAFIEFSVKLFGYD